MTAKPEGLVRGTLYLGLDDAVLTTLDHFEGDRYDRLSLSVRCKDDVERTGQTRVIRDRDDLAFDLPWKKEGFIQRDELTHFLGRYPGFDRMKSQP